MLMPFASSIKNTKDTKNLMKSANVQNILISTGTYDEGELIEVDFEGNIVWNNTDLETPQDAERLSNGNTLIVDYSAQRVVEIERDGTIVWRRIGKLKLPVDAERLPNGNTLITEFGGSITEVDSDNNIIWQITNLSSPFDAERLINGNTLIAESFTEGRVIEVDSDNNIIWEVNGLNGPVDVERLDNGNTLITEHIGKRVIEVDNEKNIVWQKTGLLVPKDAERLENGFTLIAECGASRVIIVNKEGTNEWIISDLNFYPVDVEMIPSEPPSVEITRPKENKFYFHGISMFPLLSRTVVYGPIKIEGNATSYNGLERIEVYINNKLVNTSSKEQFAFKWMPIFCGRYKIKVIAYDYFGQNSTEEIKVLKWRFHPVILALGSIFLLKLATKNKVEFNPIFRPVKK
jgi:hypothetical protein